MRPLNAGVPVQARWVRCRNPIASQEVDALKAVQAASGCNIEDGIHYHCRVQSAHSLTWQHIPSRLRAIPEIPVMIASIPFDTVIPAAVKLLF